MRTLTEHLVNTTNDQLVITVVDEQGTGNANHEYRIHSKDGTELIQGSEVELKIRFQNGAINEVGVNGITHEDLLAIVADRLRGFQDGQFKCKANECALTHIEEAMHWLNSRTLERMRRGVEGTHKP